LSLCALSLMPSPTASILVVSFFQVWPLWFLCIGVKTMM
jgi:hypothetical protein